MQSPCCSPQMFPVPLALLHQLSLHVHVMAALNQDARATLRRDRQSAVCDIWLDMNWIVPNILNLPVCSLHPSWAEATEPAGCQGQRGDQGQGHVPLTSTAQTHFAFWKQTIKNHTERYWLDTKFHFQSSRVCKYRKLPSKPLIYTEILHRA